VHPARCNHGIKIDLNLERVTERLPSQIALTLFRITQDTLYCAIHQAHASQVDICLERRNEYLLYNLTDDGILVTGDDLLPATRQRIKQLGGLIETHVGRQHGFELMIKFRLDQPVQLTPREMEVIQLVTEGLSTLEIARLLSLTARTVNFHLHNIYTKLGVSSRTEAAVYALRHGWTCDKTKMVKSYVASPVNIDR
jgi:DNA-binding NarL/FixJ family response regulator